MKLSSNPMKWFLSCVLVSLVAIGGFSGCANHDNNVDPSTVQSATKGQPADIAHAIEVQDRNTENLLLLPNVIGTGVGRTPDGVVAIYLFTGDELGNTLSTANVYPAKVEDVRTHIEHVGTVKARQVYTGAYRNPTWSGVSIGNDNECAAGTLGCVVTKDGKNYILSNNHVLARENKAALGEKIDQPGRYEVNCNPSAQVASLSEFKTINMKRTANNVIDAGIAEFTITGFTSQMAIGSYFPTVATLAATVGMPVKKTGRTTGLTTGTVQTINVTILVQYSRGTARFIRQTYITPGGFSGAGDSGSLIVEDPPSGTTYSPVGLLFAGSSSGTFANPIQDVLGAFNVTIVPN